MNVGEIRRERTNVDDLAWSLQSQEFTTEFLSDHICRLQIDREYLSNIKSAFEVTKREQTK